MVTGASTADLAVILIDARKGVLTQTRRHSYLAHLIGIERIVLAVNKMDLVGFDRSRFEAIVAEYRTFAESIGIGAFVAIPISALAGDNIATRSGRMPWYPGPALIEHLEAVEVNASGRGAGRVPHAGAVGQPAESGFPGLRGADCGRQDPGRAMPSA